MGKNYSNELENLEKTVNWSLNLNVRKATNFLYSDVDVPLISTGSGGSLSAAYFASLLNQNLGNFSKTFTPLSLIYNQKLIKQSKVLFVSASGRNVDILNCFRTTVRSEPLGIFSLIMKENSKLATLSKKYSICDYFDCDLPSGKDGFLATNSLLASFIVLAKAAGEISTNKNLNTISNLSLTPHNSLLNFVNNLSLNETIIILFGNWGMPVAIDLESKCTEAALCNVSLSDFRNFAHGRHNWLAKKIDHSALIAIVTDDENDLADKTLSLLPKQLLKTKISSKHNGAIGCIDLLIQSLLLIKFIGLKLGVDPGKPRIPDYGRNLYNLNYINTLRKDLREKDNRKNRAIIRKAKIQNLNQLSVHSLKQWYNAYDDFIIRLRSKPFGSIIFDYDGTLCSPENRYEGPDERVIKKITYLLENNFLIGIVSGRGKSLRDDLIKTFDSRYWKTIFLGYYNGAFVGSLEDKITFTKIKEINKPILETYKYLNSLKRYFTGLKISRRPTQITICNADNAQWESIKNNFREFILKFLDGEVKIIESGHSMDIVPQNITKLKLYYYMENILLNRNLSPNVLCIGDKGCWPGNDYQLLSTPYSLSVDEVSIDPDTCWNLGGLGIRGVNVTLEYLKTIDSESKKMRISK